MVWPEDSPVPHLHLACPCHHGDPVLAEAPLLIRLACLLFQCRLCARHWWSPGGSRFSTAPPPHLADYFSGEGRGSGGYPPGECSLS